jgi:meso-butanediol dehydrogenase / (S,S)-butanediol dehydrogenase / diacetyl reductase
MTNKRVIFITGGAGGIGLCTAKKFGAHGYAIALNDYRQDNGDKALQELRALGIEAALFVGDVTKEASVNTLVAQVVAHFGRLDVLFNNAGGLGGRSSAEEMSLEFWDRVVDLNLTSAFFVTRACIPHLKKSGDAAVINVTSIAAYNGGGPGASAYAVAKAGVLALTRAHAKELIPFGIRVNAISPGTPSTRRSTTRRARTTPRSWRSGFRTSRRNASASRPKPPTSSTSSPPISPLTSSAKSSS